MRAFFPYFGAKHQIGRCYPPPRHNTIIEPFAGSAGYATCHSHKNVILIEKDPLVAGVWRYLIQATSQQILNLPLLQNGESLDDQDLDPAERALIGFWFSFGLAKPATKRSAWCTINRGAWGERVRARIADQVDRIWHWTVIQGDYTDAPDTPATWFIDPPYALQGRAYVHGSQHLDYAHLGQWCRSRQGQVMVCENVGADWLPFEPYISAPSSKRIQRKRTEEALWMNSKRGFF
jgi:site-specific DNA-adenine methylase